MRLFSFPVVGSLRVGDFESRLRVGEEFGKAGTDLEWVPEKAGGSRDTRRLLIGMREEGEVAYLVPELGGVG